MQNQIKILKVAFDPPSLLLESLLAKDALLNPK